MARQRVVLQAPRALDAGDSQLNEDAVRVGNNIGGVVFADVYTGSAIQLAIDTCSDLETTVGGLSSWIEVATVTLPTSGTVKLEITELGDAIRWRLGGTGSTTLALTVFLTDKA